MLLPKASCILQPVVQQLLDAAASCSALRDVYCTLSCFEGNIGHAGPKGIINLKWGQETAAMVVAARKALAALWY